MRRPNGVEKQHLLRCRSCEVRVAYRSAVAASSGPRYLYVPPDAVSLSNRVAPAPAVPTVPAAPIAPADPTVPPTTAATVATAPAASTPAPAAPAPTIAVAPPPLAADTDSARQGKRARVEEPVTLMERGEESSGGNGDLGSRVSSGLVHTSLFR